MRPRLAPALAALSLFAAQLSFGELISASADVSGTFPPDQRDQCRVGACHVFSTIALLESALKRQYGKTIRLSEADLFVRKIVAPGRYKLMMTSAKGGVFNFEAFIEEGGDPYEDLLLAINDGVATQATVPWDKFLDEYGAFKKEADKSCSVAIGGALAKVTGGAIEAAPGKCIGKEPTFREFLDSIKTPGAVEVDAVERRLLLADTVSLHSERAAVKSLIKSFHVGRMNYPPRPDLFSDRDGCRTDGERQGHMIKAQLKEGRPLVICLRIEGLKDWAPGTREEAKHCFTTTGYEYAKRTGTTVSSRNSWGGKNPELKDKDFCRIHELVWLEP